MRLFRFWLGRHLIHLGIRAMPPGPARNEIYNILAVWGVRVMRAVRGEA